MQTNQQPQGAQAGAVDVAPIIAQVEQRIPANLKDIYSKAVLSGMRIMFDKASFQMTMAELNQPGPMATRLSNGIIKLMYMLWTQSNKTLPPQIIVPVTLTLTLRAFEFLQMTNDPDATKETLGEATQQAVQGIMDRFGATADKLPALLKGQQAGVQASAPQAGAPAAPAAASQQPSGMLAAASMGGA